MRLLSGCCRLAFVPDAQRETGTVAVKILQSARYSRSMLMRPNGQNLVDEEG